MKDLCYGFESSAFTWNRIGNYSYTCISMFPLDFRLLPHCYCNNNGVQYIRKMFPLCLDWFSRSYCLCTQICTCHLHNLLGFEWFQLCNIWIDGKMLEEKKTPSLEYLHLHDGGESYRLCYCSIHIHKQTSEILVQFFTSSNSDPSYRYIPMDPSVSTYNVCVCVMAFVFNMYT